MNMFASVRGMQQLADAETERDRLREQLAAGKSMTSYHCGGCGARVYSTMTTSRTEWGHAPGDMSGLCDPPYISDGKFGPRIIERRWIVVLDGQRSCELNNYGGVWTRGEFT